jgi:hypothetical protein
LNTFFVGREVVCCRVFSRQSSTGRSVTRTTPFTGDKCSNQASICAFELCKLSFTLLPRFGPGAALGCTYPSRTLLIQFELANIKHSLSIGKVAAIIVSGIRGLIRRAYKPLNDVLYYFSKKCRRERDIPPPQSSPTLLLGPCSRTTKY